MSKKYVVRLSSEERHELESLVRTGKAAAYKRMHAQILLKADVSPVGDGWVDTRISEAFEISVRTVENVRQRLIEGGLAAAIGRATSSGTRARKLDGEQEAHLIALSCQKPPEGRCRWSLRLLADQMVELHYVDQISHETVRQTLKKTK
jgi:transposase